MKRFFNTLLFCLLVGATPLMAQLSDVLTGLSFPYGAALAGNELYITELSADRLIKIDITDPVPPAVQNVITTGLPNPRGMSLAGNDLYIADAGLDAIVKIDISSATPSLITVVSGVGLMNPSRVLADGNFLYITDQGLDQLLRWDLMAQSLEVIASGFENPTAMAKQGDFIYLTEFGFNGNGSSVRSVDLSQSPAVVTTLSTDVFAASGITLNGNFLYVAEASRVGRLDLNAATPVIETVVTGINGAREVAFNGLDMFIAENGGGGAGAGKISKLVISTPVFSELAPVCLGDMPTTLGGTTPAGGIYSGPGVTDNGDGNTFTFDPVAAGGIGDYTITYNLGGSVASSTLSVVATPTVTFSTGDLSVTVDAGVQTGLSGGMPAGGVYSGNGVTDDGNGMTYSFDPAAAGEGENVITYTFSDANGCGGEQGAIITVTPAIPPGDNCGIAIDINSLFGQTPGEPQVSEEYNTTEYNDDPTDPNSFSLCGFDWGTNNTVPSIWSSFTGDGSTYTINSIGSGDPFVLVFSGECGAFTEVACDDDTNGFNFSVEVETEVGVEYFVYTGPAVFSNPATFNIEVTRAILPGEQCDIAIDINNLFGQAEMVPQASDTYENFADYDTDDTDVVPSCLFQLLPGSGTIWFSFTGDGNRYTINSANNSNPSNPLAGVVYSGTCGMLTEVACNYTGGVTNFTLDLQTEAGVEYSIMVTEDFVNQTESFNLEVTNMGTVSVQDIRNTEFNVYPNPTTGWVNLDGFTADRIEVLDQLGRTVRTQAQAGTGVDLTGLPAGVYVLRMQAEDQVISAKVVKE